MVRRTIISSNSWLWDVMITLNIENTGKRSFNAPFLENNQLIKTMFQILWSPGILDLQPSDCKNRRRSDFKAPASESNSTPQINWGLPTCGTQNRKTHKIAKQNISHNFEKKNTCRREQLNIANKLGPPYLWNTISKFEILSYESRVQFNCIFCPLLPLVQNQNCRSRVLKHKTSPSY